MKKILSSANIWDCKGNKKLEMFLLNPADEVLYGGAVGGAKTEGLIISCLGTSRCGLFSNPNWKVLFLRRTFPELESSAILRTQALWSSLGKYDAVRHRWTFPNGGLVQFGHIESEQDLTKYDSAEYSHLRFDELTHFTERMFLYLFTRMRTTDSRIRCTVKSGTNPGGIGHAWVKKRYIDGKEPGKIYEEVIVLPDGRQMKWSKSFIPATVYDNKILMQNNPQYVRSLMELPDLERRAKLYGDWDIFSGQFFPEFCEEHWCDDFDVPSEWPRWVSMDWGYMTRCAVLFFAQDPMTGVIYLYDEIYVKQMNVDAVSAMIKEKIGVSVGCCLGLYGDRRLSVKDGDMNVSYVEKFAYNGLFFTIVNEGREQGWHAARELLAKDENGFVKFKVMKKCFNFIRTIPEMIFDVNHPDDMQKGGEDHCADALKQFAIARKWVDLDGAKERTHDFETSPITGYLGMAKERNNLRDRISIPLRGQAIRGNWFIDRVG